jgi:hypothetical protein
MTRFFFVLTVCCAELIFEVLLFCLLAATGNVGAYVVSAVADSRYAVSIHPLVNATITTEALFAGDSALTLSAFSGRGNYGNHGGQFTG